MTEIDTNMGLLQNKMILKLQTKQAVRLWLGRDKASKKATIIGLRGFINITNKIYTGAKNDDPYCDLWILKIEAKINETAIKLKFLQKEIEPLITETSLPNFQIDNEVSATLSIYISSHLGYLALYLLAKYDEMAIQAICIYRIGLIDRATLEMWFSTAEKCLRSLFNTTTYYRNSGVTRQDLLENNTRACHAIEKLGNLPPDIIDGTRRSLFLSM